MAPKKVVEVAPVLVPPSQPPRLFNNHALIHSMLDILKQATTSTSAVVVSMSVASTLQGAELVQYLTKGAAAAATTTIDDAATTTTPSNNNTTTTAFSKKVGVLSMSPVERVAAIVAECLGVTHIYKTDPQACAMEVDVYVDALMLASERGFGSNKASALLKLIHQAKTSIVSTQSVDEAKALFRDFLVFNAGAASTEERAVALYNSVVLPFRDAFKHVGHLHSVKASLMPAPADNTTISSPTAATNAVSSAAATHITTTSHSSVSVGGVQVIPRGRFASSAAGAALFAKGMGQNAIVGGKPMASFAIKNSLRVGSGLDVAETSENAPPTTDSNNIQKDSSSSASAAVAASMKIDVPSVVAARGGSKSHPATGGGLSPRDASATSGAASTNKKSTGKSSGAKGGGDAGSQPEGFALAVQAAVIAFSGGVERELSQADIEGLNPLELAAFIPVMAKGAFTVELFVKIASAFKMPADPSQGTSANTSSLDDASATTPATTTTTAAAAGGKSSSTLIQSLSAIALAYPSAAQVSSIVEYAHTTATNLLLEIEMLTVAINTLSAAATMGVSDINNATPTTSSTTTNNSGGVLAATIAIAKSLSRFLQSSSSGNNAGGGLLGDSTSVLASGINAGGVASPASGGIISSLSPGGGTSAGNGTPSTSTAPGNAGGSAAALLFANPAALAAASGFGYYIGTGNLTGSAAVLLDEASLGAIFGDILKSIDNNVAAQQLQQQADASAAAVVSGGGKGATVKGGDNNNSIAANAQQSRSSSLQPSARDGGAAGGGTSSSSGQHPLTKSSDTCFSYDLHPAYFDTTVNLLTTVHTVPHITYPDGTADNNNATINKTPTPTAVNLAASATNGGRSTAAVADHSISPDMLNHPQEAVVVTEVLQCLPAALSTQSVPFLTSIGHGGLRYFSLDELGVVGRHVMQGLLQPWRLFALVGQFGREELFVAVEEGPGVDPVRYVMTDEQEHPLLRTTTNNANHHHHHNNRSPYARARQNRRVSSNNRNVNDDEDEDAHEETMELVPTTTTAAEMPPVSSVPLSNLPPSREPCSVIFTLALQTPLPSHPLKDAVTLDQFEKHYASEQALARQELLELQDRDRQEREADEKRKEDEAARKRAEEEEQERATLYLEKVEATKTVTRLYDTIESELGDRQGRILKRILALEMALQLEGGGGGVPPASNSKSDPITTFSDDM